MTSENETVADIVQEMRDIFALTGIDKNKSHLMGFFERIEAAHGREVDELRRCLKVAEDALGESKVAVCHTCNSKCYCGYEGAKFDPCCVYKDIDKALALIHEEGGTK